MVWESEIHWVDVFYGEFDTNTTKGRYSFEQHEQDYQKLTLCWYSRYNTEK